MRRVRGDPGGRGAAGGARPGEVGQRERADVALPGGRDELHARAGPLERVAQLGVGGPQPGRRAERDEQDVDRGHAGDRAMLTRPVTGTLINVVAILLGTLLGTLVGDRLPERLRRRVLDGLGLVTLVIGVDLALAWRDTNALYVLGGVLLGAIVGEALGIEAWLERLGDRLQGWVSRFHGAGHQVSEAFFTASLLFCVGPLTIVGSIQDGLTGDYQALATKALLDGFASIALAASLGPGVAFAAVSVLVVQGAISLDRRPVRLDPRRGQRGARRTDERRRRAHHRDQPQAPRRQGREGRQLPAGARLRPGAGRARQPLLSVSARAAPAAGRAAARVCGRA